MKITNKIKYFIELKKCQLKAKHGSIKEQIFLKYIFPQLIQYLRAMIVSQGKNPDYVPPKQPNNVTETKQLFDKRPSFKFNEYMPSWVAASFKDPTKHPIFHGRQKELPVVEEKIEDVEVVLPSDMLKNIEKDFNIIEKLNETVKCVNIIEKLNETVKCVEEEIVEQKAKKKTHKKRPTVAKKSVKKKPVKIKDIKKSENVPTEVKVAKTWGNGSFRRVAVK
jgi:hypothetical protein